MNFLDIFSLNNFAFCVIFFLVIILAYRFGRKIGVSLILAVYPTVLIFNNLSFLKVESKTTGIIILGALYLLALFVIWSNIHTHNSHNNVRKIIDYVLLSAGFMVLLSAVANDSLTILQSFINLGSFSKWITSHTSYGLSLLIPLTIILVTNKKNNY